MAILLRWPYLNDNDAINSFPGTNALFKYKSKNVEIVVPLKYLINF